MLPLILILAAAFLLVVLPQLWIHRTMERHAVERPDLPGTGGEFARHVLDRLNMGHVKVEATELGNHYDPEAKAVRLEPRLLAGRSVAAVAVAAHEIGHAIQDAMGLPSFRRRMALAKFGMVLSWVAGAFVWAAPLLMMIGKTPAALVLNVIGFVGTAAVSIILQATTLPVEFDASFKRALPLIERGGYLDHQDLPAARELLKAAAYTYVAGLLRTLVVIPGMGRLPRL
jgi:uncharacterized protein